MSDNRTRLIQLLGMLGSVHDGEVLNAARHAQRILGSMNLTWKELLQGMDQQALANAAYEQGFLDGKQAGRNEVVTPHAPKPKKTDWQALAHDLNQQPLNSWEQGFILTFISRRWVTPTPKQEAVLRKMAAKFGLEVERSDDFDDV